MRTGGGFLTTDFAGNAKVWDAATFEEVRTFYAFSGIVALSRDGRRMAFIDEGSTVGVSATRRPARRCSPRFDGRRPDRVPHLQPGRPPPGDGELGQDREDLGRRDRPGDPHPRRPQQRHHVGSLQRRRPARATASWDKTAKVWDAASGKEQFTLRGHEHRVLSVAFRPGGKCLATASQDNTVRIWDAATGRETTVLRGHTGYVMSVAFSPDGTHLASAGGYRTRGDVKFWDASLWDDKPVR